MKRQHVLCVHIVDILVCNTHCGMFFVLLWKHVSGSQQPPASMLMQQRPQSADT